MTGPDEWRLLGARLEPEEADTLELTSDVGWRVVGPAALLVWWDSELAASPYSAELIGPASIPVIDGNPFAELPDALYRNAYGRSLESWQVLFHADSLERRVMTAEVFRIDSGRGLIDWRLGREGPPTLTISAVGTYDDWLAQLPALARTAQRIFRKSSRRGRPPGTRARFDAEYRDAEVRLTRRKGRPPTIEEMADEAGVSDSTIKRWRRGL